MPKVPDPGPHRSQFQVTVQVHQVRKAMKDISTAGHITAMVESREK